MPDLFVANAFLIGHLVNINSLIKKSFAPRPQAFHKPLVFKSALHCLIFASTTSCLAGAAPLDAT